MTDAAPPRGQPAGHRRPDARPFADRVADNRAARLAALPGRPPASTPGHQRAVPPPDSGIAVVTLVATATFGITTLLALLVLALLPPVVLGWPSTVIESSSMQPTVVRGDIVVLRPIEDRVDVGAVVRFPAGDGGSSIVHRVVEVDLEAAAYVTKGDANQDDDGALVPFEELDGIGTVLIPLVGHPALWFREGDYLTLALTVLAGAGVLLGGLGADARRSVTSDGGLRPSPSPEATPTNAELGAVLVGQPLGPWSIGGRRHRNPFPLPARPESGWDRSGSP